MAVGARDYIDQLLVKKYADEKVDNHDAMESMINPEKMLEAMSVLARVRVSEPVRIGDTIVDDLLATGVKVVATSNIG